MRNNFLTYLIIILLFLGAVSSVCGQETEIGVRYNKVGKNPYTLEPSAALEVESATRGFLPPRMDKSNRDVIKKPVAGLIVWCNDCDESTTPKKGQLSVYTGSEWITYLPPTANPATKPDNPVTDAPVRLSDTSVQIIGHLGNTFGIAPTETGFLLREIIGNDFATLPVFNSNGSVTVPTYNKHTNSPVTTSYNRMEVTVSDSNSKNPYYFRSFVKSLSGISYGNTMIFNLAPPVISISPVTFIKVKYSFLLVITGKLTVNAGTSPNTITEYGYCISSETIVPTTADNKVVLSSTTAADALALDMLNDKLNSGTFTANPTASLVVKDVDLPTGSDYFFFRYYAVANGKTIYSDVVSFGPYFSRSVNMGGSAKATVSNYTITKLLRIGEESTSKILISFKVIEAGNYSFSPGTINGTTKGLKLIPGGLTGTFATSDVGKTVTVEFPITGTPEGSLSGNSFEVSGIGSLITGDILPFQAICDGSVPTTVLEVTDAKGKKWMDRNLGASRAATSINDYQAIGCLFQWGRSNDGAASVNWESAKRGWFINGYPETLDVRSDGDTPGNQFIPINGNPLNWRSTPNPALWQGVNGKNNPCPSGYRIPTQAEFQGALTGVTNIADAYATKLKLVKTLVVGNYNYFNFNNDTERSAYWTSNLVDDDKNKVYVISFGTSSYSYQDKYGVRDATSVRCIKDK